MLFPDGKRYLSAESLLRQRCGERLQRLVVDAGFTCPNRDGSLGTEGCSFCNNAAFHPAYSSPSKSVRQQLGEGISFHARRGRSSKLYLAYFQSFSNTYAPLERLREVYLEALGHPACAGIVIGTQNMQHPLWTREPIPFWRRLWSWSNTASNPAGTKPSAGSAADMISPAAHGPSGRRPTGAFPWAATSSSDCRAKRAKCCWINAMQSMPFRWILSNSTSCNCCAEPRFSRNTPGTRKISSPLRSRNTSTCLSTSSSDSGPTSASAVSPLPSRPASWREYPPLRLTVAIRKLARMVCGGDGAASARPTCPPSSTSGSQNATPGKAGCHPFLNSGPAHLPTEKPDFAAGMRRKTNHRRTISLHLCSKSATEGRADAKVQPKSGEKRESRRTFAANRPQKAL